MMIQKTITTSKKTTGYKIYFLLKKPFTYNNLQVTDFLTCNGKSERLNRDLVGALRNPIHGSLAPCLMNDARPEGYTGHRKDRRQR